MKSRQLKEEEDEEHNKSSRDSLLTFIATSLNRYNTSKKSDLKGVLMLIAALSLLNSSDSSGIAISTARRLASSKYK